MEETKSDPQGESCKGSDAPFGGLSPSQYIIEKQNQVYDQYKNDTSFKTSHDWYKLTSLYKNMILPDGWKHEKNPKIFWHMELISFSDYLNRVNISTFVMSGHRLFGKEFYVFGETLSTSDYVNAALSFAVHCHEGQTLKDDITPFIEHTLGVGKLIRKFVPETIEDFSVSDLVIAAYLFNVMKHDYNRYQIISQSFGKKIADLLSEVYIDNTEMKEMGRKEYFMYKMQYMSIPGLILTYCERLDNWGYENEENKKIVGKNNTTEIQDLIASRMISGIRKYILEKLALAFFQSDDVMTINGIRKL